MNRLHIIHVPGVDPERDSVVTQVSEQIETCVHPDPDRNGCMWNWLTAVKCAAENDTDQTWSAILSDDALPVEGWRSALAEATLYAPAPVLGLTYFGGFTESAVRRGYPFIVGPHLIWGGAVAYSRDVLPGLSDWAHFIYDETRYQHDDRLISAYAQKIGQSTSLCTRAIFDQPVEASLIGHSGGNRRPSITIATPGPARMLRWASTPRALVRTSGAAVEQRDWLVKYGTPEQRTDYTFEAMRSGYVKKVPL